LGIDFYLLSASTIFTKAYQIQQMRQGGEERVDHGTFINPKFFPMSFFTHWNNTQDEDSSLN